MNATRQPSPGQPPAGQDPVPPTRSSRGVDANVSWPALYQEPGICVTAEWFIVGSRRFPVNELRHLQTARGPHDPLVARTVLVTGAVLVGIGAALSFTRDVAELSAATYLALGAAAFVPMLLAALGQRIRPRPFELWAQYKGQAIMVFSSDHEHQYGQVTRALVRAREMGRLGGVAEPVASTDPWRPPPR